MLITFFFFNDTATTEIYTLSLHDALPISIHAEIRRAVHVRHDKLPQGAFAILRAPDLRPGEKEALVARETGEEDRKSTRLNSSHSQISYAVFCLKKKKHLWFTS